MAQLRQTWDNRHFFSGSDDPQIAHVVEQLQANISALAEACSSFGDLIDQADSIPETDFAGLIDQLKHIHQREEAIARSLGNVRTFIASVLSVDSQDAQATVWMPRLQQVGAALSQATTPVDVFLVRASDALIAALLAEPALEELTFSITHRRRLKDQLLTMAEERLITGLGVTGLHAWGNLYDELTGRLQCEIDGETMGLAQAANRLSSGDRATRVATWKGIRRAWETCEVSAASILNAINGWRLEETAQRSQIRELHYLDKSCHQNRIERQTLNALMETTYQQRSIGQRALKAMGKALEIPQMAAWDLFAPAPSANGAEKIPFDTAIALIAKAFSRLTPAMGDFAILMAERGWIDAQPTPNRTTGAYCTSFREPREPRIFLTYEGTMNNVMTLAHELGHAWHNWVMRDLPLAKTYYASTLAETASIFAETLVRDDLLSQAKGTQQQLEVAWQNADSAAAFLLNIPARFEFETRLVEARKQGYVTPEQLKKMMADSWQHWYEDSLSDYDDMFWASKLHFSISGIGFYNYPYLFGYLFSLGIYAQQEKYGEAFNDLYTGLLRDTGTMTAEALIMHHLQQDIRQPQFWQDSLDIVELSVTQFEKLVAQGQTAVTV